MSDEQKDAPEEEVVETTAPVAEETPTAPEEAAPATEEAAPATEAAAPAPEEAAPATEEAEPATEEAKEETKEEEKKDGKPTVAQLLGDEVAPIKARRVKGSKNVSHGIVHVKATFNNTVVSISDLSGNIIAWSSAGRAGFKGSRKSTAYAGTVVAQEAARTAVSHGLQEAEIRLQGPGAGRESAVRAIQGCGITVSVIRDVTPVPHNGCRPKKRRRV